MAELGGLLLWAATPLAALAAVLSLAGGWTGRGELAVAGGRAAESTVVLLLLSVAGLATALLDVRLEYSYVAAYTGFQDPWPARLAALWSAPAGAALVLTFLVTAAAVGSFRAERSRGAAARTGTLAALGFTGLLLVLVRAQPFHQPESPAAAGAGLRDALADSAWQVETWMAMLAVLCAAFVFAEITGQQVAEAAGPDRRGRRAIAWMAAALTLAVGAAAWRAYAASGRLLDAAGVEIVAVHLPGWLLAFGYLQAPGGRAVPAWAARWRRAMGVALFPAALGGFAALMAGAGDAPPPVIWGSGLAVGIASGALAGAGPARPTAESLRTLPGYGAWAFQGGVIALLLAGLAMTWGLVGGPIWSDLGPAAMLVSVAMMCAWALARPAGGWRHVWPIGVGAALAAGVAAHLASDGDAAFTLAAALGAAALLGLAADAFRVRRARIAVAGAVDEPQRQRLRARARRRGAATTAHLGVALAVVALAAGGLSRTESRAIGPGDSLTVQTAGGPARVVYLGMSQYRVGFSDRRVASFSLYRGDRRPELIAASLTWDPVARRQHRTPHLDRGVLDDVVVAVTGLRGGENILCSLSVRPLAGLAWLGGALVLLAALAVRGPDA
ncbi:MAG: hypothetical protein GWN99_11190 [Gemmatimonadetes bacterium]|uniref:Cytochrome c-type biogenesis protein CcmF C-terminal domain-containing protein n=1 Tax=Candidatus Kutchimonas denitrificans TaxID=3056748 RepID=A0AAE5CBZ4_9BACT|nr:hypothetical protein [Gemmatimonadota bacterium]NIR75030.1 hypothetical protein [Candidatus Kutchimonas denitrificans]NIS01612.1 hypothetical protein [Gemmatimonadota bacterium]NIT67350.1 hypothetical protein [Gemmatimonadota bacterium]NIU52713.1 hypothetical protein [Gemmatimonadota bacterium]